MYLRPLKKPFTLVAMRVGGGLPNKTNPNSQTNKNIEKKKGGKTNTIKMVVCK